MRTLPPIVVIAVVAVLSGCTPRQDIEVYNDTGESVVVTALGQSVSVAPRGSTRFAFILARGQHLESVQITAGRRSWTYPQKDFLRIPDAFWHHEAVDARRAYVSVDSHGRIRLRSASGATGQSRITQPAGFPIEPQTKT